MKATETFVYFVLIASWIWLVTPYLEKSFPLYLAWSIWIASLAVALALAKATIFLAIPRASRSGVREQSQEVR